MHALVRSRRTTKLNTSITKLSLLGRESGEVAASVAKPVVDVAIIYYYLHSKMYVAIGFFMNFDQSSYSKKLCKHAQI